MRKAALLRCLAWATVVACASGHGVGSSSSATGGEQGGTSGSTASGVEVGAPTGSSGGPNAGGTSGATSSGDVPGSRGGAAGASGGSGVDSSGSVAASGASGSSMAGSMAADAGSGIDAGTHPDASTPDGGHSNKVLIYTATTGFRHASIPAAATAIAAAATAAGLDPVLSPADPTKMTTPVPADFATGALAPYGAVVLLATSGQPLGAPGTEQIQTLIDFVEGGGGLVAIEDASHCYDGDFPPISAPYIALIGADFNGHTGFGPGTCATVGSHPTNAMLPAIFAITDEVYYFKDVAADMQVVLQCENPGAAPRPISWVRTQGAGRVFYTALGHADPSWTTGPLVPDHVLPALLWTMGR
jgi:uncharacterized protein